MENLTLEQVATKHPYYGTGSVIENYETFQQFYDDMIEYDVDMNLCYRWDVNKDEGDNYSAVLFTILQRKGRICEHHVESFVESDIPLLEAYLKPNMETLNELWKPFKLQANGQRN